MGRFGSVDQLVDADPARVRALWQELLGDRPYDEAMSALLEAQQERDQARRDAFEAALAMFMTATERPTCRFEFDVTNVPAWDMHRRFFVDLENNHIRHELGSQYTNLNQMLFLLLDSDVDAAQSLERYLGLLRAPAHIRSGQPSLVLADQLYVESDILRRIGKWGSGKSRTADELRDAIDKLQAHLATPLHPAESIYADYLLVKIVIDGEQLPIALAAAPYNVLDSLAVNWAYAANRLPWERRRALEALKILAAEQMQIAENTVQCLTSGNSPDTPRNSSQLRARLQDGDYGWDPVFGGRRQPADSSSLARLELRARCNEAALVAALAHAEVYRRATLLQVALVLYRLENDRYPPNLAQLAPDYLDSVPLDPFTGKQFHYLPHGLDEPLRLLHRPRDSRIPARTPFFWSVGAWNADQPSLGETSQTIVDEDDPSREVIERRETVYQLTSRTTEYPDDRYVFPLPK